jgi:hypothetical protein
MSNPPEVKPFRYNPTHDLESLWWIAVFFVVSKETTEAPSTVPSGDSKTAAEASKASNDNMSVNPVNSESTVTSDFISPLHGGKGAASVASSLTDAQRNYARSIFYGYKARNLAMTVVDNNPLDQHMRSLPSHLLRICEPLIELRRLICEHYEKIERPGFIITNKVCINLYSSFTDAFSAILDSLRERDIIVTPLRNNIYEEGHRKFVPRDSATGREKFVSVQQLDENRRQTRSSTSKRRQEEETGSSMSSKRSRLETK